MADPATRRALLGVPSDVFATWHDPHAEDLAYAGLAAAYGLVALVALAQLARIHARVPEYGWTTQKTFHALNFLCAASRALLFARRDALDALIETTERDSTESGEVAAVRFWRVTRDVAFDLPCALFLTAYALLVLFWAEIYLRARGATRTTTPRRTFFLANFILYAALAAVWTAGAFARGEAARRRLEACATLVVASFAFILAASFARYGGCLFQMLRRFPPQFKGRRRKLREVGAVTATCALCFTLRAAAASADAAMRLMRTKSSGESGSGGDDTEETRGGGFLDTTRRHYAADVAYYAACELFPAATALVILRKLPPRPAAAATRGDERV